MIDIDFKNSDTRAISVQQHKGKVKVAGAWGHRWNSIDIGLHLL